MNKKLLGLAIVILLAATIGALFYLFQLKKLSDVTTEPASFAVEQTELEEPTKYFPEGFPIETGVTLLQNYESKSTEGAIQATVVTTTNKELVVAVADLVEFFENHDWVEIESLFSRTPNQVLASLKHGDDRILIDAKQDGSYPEPIVSVTFTGLAQTK